MHSNGQIDRLYISDMSTGTPPEHRSEWDGFAEDARLTVRTELAAMRSRHMELAVEHRDLDDMIALLAGGAVLDEGLITRLKKRKLHIKDELVRMEATLFA